MFRPFNGQCLWENDAGRPYVFNDRAHHLHTATRPLPKPVTHTPIYRFAAYFLEGEKSWDY
jgi:hypothetical protein